MTKLAGLAAVAAVLATAAVFGAASRAEAREDEHQLSLDLGLSVLKIDNKATNDVGGGVGVGYQYGLNDQFNLLADAGYSLVALGQDDGDTTILHTRPGAVTTFGVGAAYVLDILTWVPYGGLLAEGYYMRGGTIDGGKLLGGAEIVLGVDYKLSRHLSVGVAYKQHMLLTDISTYPLYFNLLARVEYAWGW